MAPCDFLFCLIAPDRSHQAEEWDLRQVQSQPHHDELRDTDGVHQGWSLSSLLQLGWAGDRVLGVCSSPLCWSEGGGKHAMCC